MILIIKGIVKSRPYEIVENINKCLVLYTRQVEPGLLLYFLHQIWKYCYCTGAISIRTGALSVADKTHAVLCATQKTNTGPEMPKIHRSWTFLIAGCLVNVVICSQCGSSASQLTSGVAHYFKYVQCHFWGSLLVCILQGPTADAKGTDGNIQTEETALLNHCTQQPPEPLVGSPIPARTWRQIFACPPQGLPAQTVTNGR